MKQRDDIVLVIGSKPGSSLPELTPKCVFTANAAAERAQVYRSGPHLPLTCVAARGELRKHEVHSRIYAVNPDRIVTRGPFNFSAVFPEDWLAQRHTIEFDSKGYLFQKKYFSRMNLMLAEIGGRYYCKGARNAFARTRRILLENLPIQGLSTGLWAALLAYHEHPDCKIVLSGISLVAGGHFYGSGKFSSHRAWADRYLVARLPQKMRKNLLTTDDDVELIQRFRD